MFSRSAILMIMLLTHTLQRSKQRLVIGQFLCILPRLPIVLIEWSDTSCQFTYFLHQTLIFMRCDGSPLASSPGSRIVYKEGEPGIQHHVSDVGPIYKGRKGGGSWNFVYVSHIFKHSKSTWMEDMVSKPSSECCRILEGLNQLCLINWSWWTDSKSTVVDRLSFMMSCQHLSRDIGSQAPPLSLVYVGDEASSPLLQYA